MDILEDENLINSINLNDPEQIHDNLSRLFYPLIKNKG